ncbi:MAG: glycerol-3-phosphate acyltransferase [Truepera sp.]|nr:glycerol-3-phosphate acyltransferase [Truepera sp.]
MTAALLILAAYLIGSLTFGVILSRLRGADIRTKDLPGGSGVFRQMGPAWAAAVIILDVLKGALVFVLSQLGDQPWLIPALAAAVVAGHNWPLYFGFRGGGGIAPSVGFLLLYDWDETLIAAAIGLAIAALYYALFWRTRRKAIYPIPFGAGFGYLALLILFWAGSDTWGAWAVALAGLAVAARGLTILRQPRLLP